MTNKSEIGRANATTSGAAEKKTRRPGIQNSKQEKEKQNLVGQNKEEA